MANTFKKVIDTLVWRQVPPMPNAHAAAAAVCAFCQVNPKNPLTFAAIIGFLLLIIPYREHQEQILVSLCLGGELTFPGA